MSTDKTGTGQGTTVRPLSETSITAATFLEEIFGELPDDEIALVAKQRSLSTGGFLQMSSASTAFERWSSRGTRGSWYFCVSTVVDPGIGESGRPEPPRRRKDDCVAACCVVLDDVGTKVSAEEADLPAPSWRLETSPGNEQWGYILDEPTSDWELYEGFLRVLAAEGATDGGSVDRSHVFRLPGSENLKPQNEGFRARLLTWEPARAWTMAGLLALFDVEEDECRAAARAAGVGRPASRRERRIGGVVVPEGLQISDEVLDWLLAEGMVRGGVDGEFVHIVCPWTGEHSDPEGGSVSSTSYSPLGRGSDEWIMRRGFRCLHEHCRGRSTHDFLKQVAKMGGPAANAYDPLQYLQAQFAVVKQGRVVADLDQRPRGGTWIWEFEEFALDWREMYLLPGYDRRVQLATAFLHSRDTRKLARQTYRPDLPDAIVIEHDQECLNTYTRPWHEPTSEAPEVFLAHMEYLLPDAGEREWFLSWLAFKAQHPARRPPAVIMVADETQGTGRSWLGEMLRQVFRDLKHTTLAHLAGEQGGARFNEWEWQSQIVVIEEAKDQIEGAAAFHAYETMKRRVDTSSKPVTIDVKLGAKQTTLRYYSVIIFSNHADAVKLPASDRRFCVLSNPAAPHPDGAAYYTRLYDALENEGGSGGAGSAGEAARVYAWLMARDTTGFDSVTAPMTEAKARMIAMTRSSSDEIVEDTVSSARGDVVSQSDLLRLAEAERDGRGQTESVPTAHLENAVKRVWRRLPRLNDDAKHGFRIGGRADRREIRALRNAARWRAEGLNDNRAAVEAEAEKNRPGFRPAAPKLSLLTRPGEESDS